MEILEGRFGWLFTLDKVEKAIPWRMTLTDFVFPLTCSYQ